MDIFFAFVFPRPDDPKLEKPLPNARKMPMKCKNQHLADDC
jgi:hypothetical protein